MITVEFLNSRTAHNLMAHLNKVINVYHRGGFKINTILMDIKFEPLTNKLENVECNTTATRKHVGEIERKIRTIKERCRSTVATLPFEFLPKHITIYLVYFIVFLDSCIFLKKQHL